MWLIIKLVILVFFLEYEYKIVITKCQYVSITSNVIITIGYPFSLFICIQESLHHIQDGINIMSPSNVMGPILSVGLNRPELV